MKSFILQGQTDDGITNGPGTALGAASRSALGPGHGRFRPGGFGLRCCGLLLGLAAMVASLPAGGATATRLAVVPKWGRFEEVFKSNFEYPNPLQSATLKVRFTSPLGETSQVEGFWDGGKIWRVRFAPDQPGRWSFKTACSDAANTGLDNQSGQFVCTAPLGQSRFQEHGLIQVARDHRHLEHTDGTPFFWLADTVWTGARRSEPKAWEMYARVRADQNFTVAQWTVAPGPDDRNESGLTGFPDQIGVNPEFFKRLDAKVETLRQAGLLSAIVPLSEMAGQKGEVTLREDQAVLFLRYVVARFGADPVVWLLAFEGDSKGEKVGRWKRIGHEVFSEIAHAPVVLYPGQTPWLLEEFRDQPWVDVFGFPTLTDVTDDALKWLFTGPVGNEWTREPPRPLIPFTPYENAPIAHSAKRFSASDVRHAAYWGLLLAPPAGVSYGGQGVINWDTTTEPRKDDAFGADLPLWQKALFMPAAKQMGHLAQLLNSLEFWQLRPAAKALASQPGDAAPSHQIAAETANRNLAILYIPRERSVELYLEALPPAPVVTWFNPRLGESSPAVSVAAAPKCEFPTPGLEDWVLVLRAGR